MSALTDIQKRKQELRAMLKSQDEAHDMEERRAGSAALCARIFAQPAWREARFILSFAPMPLEPDVWPLSAAALAQGKRLALPRYSAESGAYEAAEVADLDRDVIAGKFGIREPAAACPAAPRNQLDLAIVPAIGFGPNLERLGRGKGHYDRLLAGLEAALCGVAFDWQTGVAVPVEPHDIPADFLASPSHWLARRRSR